MPQRKPDRILGGDHNRFWAYCEQGELRLQRCDGCGTLRWPVARTCERCAATSFAWERVSGAGRIVSWCAFGYDYYKGLLPVPYDALLVELAEGPLFIGNPLGFGYDDIAPGMAVRVAFIDVEDTAGPYRLPVFERA